MKSYKLSDGFFRQLFSRAIAIGALFVLVVIIINLQVSIQNGNYLPLLVAVPFCIAALGVGIFISLRQQEKLWRSYRIVIEGDTIKRTQENLPEIRILRQNIAKIENQMGKSLLIQSRHPGVQIVIPITLEEFNDLRALLEQWHSIDSLPASPVNKFIRNPLIGSLFWIALTVVGFVVLFTSTNVYVIIVVGILYLALLGTSLVIMQRDVNTTKQAKRQAWIVILPMFAVLARLASVISELAK